MRARLTRLFGSAAEVSGRAVRRLPGLLSMGFGIAGAAVLWGTGWALLTASAFLLVMAYEVN